MPVRLPTVERLWSGAGLVRGGAGTTLVGSYDEVADSIAEHAALGLDHVILPGHPHLEEAHHVGEGVRPALARLGLLDDEPAPDTGRTGAAFLSSPRARERVLSPVQHHRQGRHQ